MPTRDVITAVERSALIGNAPTSAQINQAMALAAVAPVRLLGSARIVRQTVVGSPTAGFITNATWVMEWPDSLTGDALVAARRALMVRLYTALHEQSSDWQAIAGPYAEGINGPLTFWESGTAANTRTRDSFATWTGRADTDENPLGPTTNAQTSPADVARAVAAAVNPLGNLPPAKDWKPIAYAVLGITALIYFGGPIANALNARTASRAASAAARKNPRRRAR